MDERPQPAQAAPAAASTSVGQQVNAAEHVVSDPSPEPSAPEQSAPASAPANVQVSAPLPSHHAASTSLPEPANQYWEESRTIKPMTPSGPVLLVIGGPGSGKDTVCDGLVGKYAASGCAHLSAVELLRKAVTAGSPSGLMISNMIRSGQIVPAQVPWEAEREREPDTLS